MRLPPSPRLIRSPWDAEDIAAEWMRYWGYVDAFPTGGGGPDKGVDVEAGAAVAQVKAEVRAAGRPVVQQTFGVAAHEEKDALVFSLGGFSDEAVWWANDAGVALFEFDLSGEPSPLNGHAHKLAAAGPEDGTVGNTRLLCNSTVDVHLALEAIAQVRDARRLPHVMCVGPAEVGKDAAERLSELSNAAVSFPDIASLDLNEKHLEVMVANADSGEIVALEGIERLSSHDGTRLVKALSGAMEIVLGSGATAQRISLDLPPFSLMGITEVPGLVPERLRHTFEWWIVWGGGSASTAHVDS